MPRVLQGARHSIATTLGVSLIVKMAGPAFWQQSLVLRSQKKLKSAAKGAQMFPEYGWTIEERAGTEPETLAAETTEMMPIIAARPFCSSIVRRLALTSSGILSIVLKKGWKRSGAKCGTLPFALLLRKEGNTPGLPPLV